MKLKETREQIVDFLDNFDLDEQVLFYDIFTRLLLGKVDGEEGHELFLDVKNAMLMYKNMSSSEKYVKVVTTILDQKL